MELTFDDQKMQFYPAINTVYELLVSIVEKIATSLPGVYQSFISKPYVLRITNTVNP
jgi:hypothetical protein